jgi:acyl-coenzyme A thioesterase PaaI-like protein
MSRRARGDFLAPAKPGPIITEAKVTQIAFVAGNLLARDGTVLATATASELVLDAERALQG